MPTTEAAARRVSAETAEMDTDDAERLKAVLDLASGWPTFDALSILTAAILNVIHQAANGDSRETDRLIATLVAELRAAARRRRSQDKSSKRLH